MNQDTIALLLAALAGGFAAHHFLKPFFKAKEDQCGHDCGCGDIKVKTKDHA